MLGERHEYQKLQLFHKFRAVLIGILPLASLVALFQALDAFRSTSIRWYYRWIPNVGVSHIYFYITLVIFIILWVPHSTSDVYAYTEQSDDENNGDADSCTVHAVDDADQFNGNGSSVVPDRIGASDDQ